MVLLKYLKIQLDTDLKIILLNRQNNDVGNWLLEYQNFLQHCSLYLTILHNYFDGPTILFLDLYLIKFLDSSAKTFFPWRMYIYGSFILSTRFWNLRPGNKNAAVTKCIFLLHSSRDINLHNPRCGAHAILHLIEARISLPCGRIQNFIFCRHAS